MAAPYQDASQQDPFGFMQVPMSSGGHSVTATGASGNRAPSAPSSMRGGPAYAPPSQGQGFWDPNAPASAPTQQAYGGPAIHAPIPQQPAPSFAQFSNFAAPSTFAPGSMGTMNTAASISSVASVSSMSAGGFGASGLDDEFANEPPLLVELGVDFVHIRAKVGGVLNITKTIDPALMADADMAGPLVFALILGFALLMAGKLHFGYIYGFGMVGSLAVYLLVNLMADPAHSLDVYRTISILGYCLLPIVALAGVAVFIDLRGAFGAGVGIAAVLWCTQSATRFFEGALLMREQRYLIAYPALLLYAVFALITIF